jgi:hypothetical protein
MWTGSQLRVIEIVLMVKLIAMSIKSKPLHKEKIYQ